MVGGIPGLVMLGAGAWYTMYQNQEQARRSAQDYANTIDQIRSKTKTMSLPEASDNEAKTRQALDEQNRLIDEQAKRLGSYGKKFPVTSTCWLTLVLQLQVTWLTILRA